MTFAMMLSAGSSIKGPITRVSEIKGLSGNAATAIASERGEFRASVVKLSAVISSGAKPVFYRSNAPVKS